MNPIKAENRQMTFWAGNMIKPEPFIALPACFALLLGGAARCAGYNDTRKTFPAFIGIFECFYPRLIPLSLWYYIWVGKIYRGRQIFKCAKLLILLNRAFKIDRGKTGFKSTQVHSTGIFTGGYWKFSSANSVFRTL